MTIDLSLLQHVPLFAALPESELALLGEQLRPCHFADGELVLREGENCQEFYIITAGQVNIFKALGTPDQRLLAVRPAGTVVGELSLFSPGGRHTASVQANGALDMLAMTRADFDKLLSSQPRLAYGMVQTLSLRLIESEQSTIKDLHAKNDALAEAYHSLQAAQAQIIEKEKIERELEVARRLQRSLLSTEPLRVTGYDFAALLEPMSAVGGDFYDFFQFPDGRVGLAIGDVSDHGVPAALLVTMTITLLRAAAHSPATPAEVLRSVNRGLLEFNLSGMFVTVLYGVLDPRRREFSYARAGHEPPLLHLAQAQPLTAPPRSAEESGMWIVDRSAWAAPGSPAPAKTGTDRLSRRRGKGPILVPDELGNLTKDERRTTVDPSSSVLRPSSGFKRGQVLGVFPELELDEQRLPLPARSTMLLYTDGAREAWDAAGNQFGEKGLRAVLAETESEPAQSVCDRLLQRLNAYRGPAPQQDDITLVAVRA